MHSTRGRSRSGRTHRQTLHRVAIGQATVRRIAMLQPRRIRAVIRLHIHIGLRIADAALVQLGPMMVLLLLLMVRMMGMRQ